MRADRLLSMLLLLQMNGRMTARELAARLEVSQRTIYRDLDALSAAGVPVYAESGAGGGCYLSEGYRTSLTGLTDPEVRAVFLSGAGRWLSDLGLRDAANTALVKLLASLPERSRPDAEEARTRIHVDSPSPADESANRWLPQLQEGVWTSRALRVTYERGDGPSLQRLVNPLGLVVRGTTWYLVAASDDEVRTYRVSRVAAVELTEELAERPAGFDLGAYWEISKARFEAALPRYPATLRVAPQVVPRIRHSWRYARIEHEDPPDEEGWIRLQVLCETEYEARAYILSSGTAIEVLDPPELREAVIAQARRVIEFQQRSSSH